MIYTRSHSRSYDEWADHGCGGWDWQTVLPGIRRAEDNATIGGELNGQDGPLDICEKDAPCAICRAIIDDFEAGIRARRYDLSPGGQLCDGAWRHGGGGREGPRSWPGGSSGGRSLDHAAPRGGKTNAPTIMIAEKIAGAMTGCGPVQAR